MPNQYPTGLNGWLFMSRAQYNAITPDAYTKYTVKDGDEVHEYLGDVEITAEDGTAWVTKAFYDVDQQAVRDVIEAIYDDVEELKTWRTETIAPWKADITDRVTALETYVAQLRLQVSTLISDVSALDSSVVKSADFRLIDEVDELPENPLPTTLYVVGNYVPSPSSGGAISVINGVPQVGD